MMVCQKQYMMDHQEQCIHTQVLDGMAHSSSTVATQA